MVLMNREGVTQGNSLVMTVYRVALSFLVEHLHVEYPNVLQLWYANNGAIHGRGFCVALYLKDLVCAWPMFGYYPETTKSLSI